MYASLIEVHVNALINVQNMQMEIMKELIMLEQRIICRVLPRNFNSLDHLIRSQLRQPLLDEVASIEFKNQSYKIIQQLKRTYLNIYLQTFETKFHEYENQYHENMHRFQLAFECQRNMPRISALHSIKAFLKSRKQRRIQQIFDDMPDFRKKLLKYRQRSKITKDTIDVSPQPVFYLLHNPFTRQERDYLSKGKPFCVISLMIGLISNTMIDSSRSKLY